MHQRSISLFFNKISLIGGIIGVCVILNRVIGVIGNIELVWQYKKDIAAGVKRAVVGAEPYVAVIETILFFLAIFLIWLGVVREKKLVEHSPFTVEFAGSESPFRQIKIGEDFIEQFFRVRIWNMDKKRAIGMVSVTLNSLNPQPNLLYAFPVPLRFSNDMKPPFDQSRVLGEHQGEFIDVVSFKHSEELPQNRGQLHVEHAIPSQSQIIPNGNYDFELVVTGDNVPPTKKKFNIYMSRGILTLVPSNENFLLNQLWSFWSRLLSAIPIKWPVRKAVEDGGIARNETLGELSNLYFQGLEIYNQGFDSEQERREWTNKLDRWIVQVVDILSRSGSSSAMHSFQVPRVNVWRNVPNKDHDWAHLNSDILIKYSSYLHQLDEIIRFEVI